MTRKHDEQPVLVMGYRIKLRMSREDVGAELGIPADRIRAYEMGELNYPKWYPYALVGLADVSRMVQEAG